MADSMKAGMDSVRSPSASANKQMFPICSSFKNSTVRPTMKTPDAPSLQDRAIFKCGPIFEQYQEEFIILLAPLSHTVVPMLKEKFSCAELAYLSHLVQAKVVSVGLQDF